MSRPGSATASAPARASAPGPQAWLGLAQLELRRLLSPGVALLLLAALALGWFFARDELLVDLPLEDGATRQRGAARQTLALLVLFASAPLWLVRAAGLAQRWRRGEADWLAARLASPGPALVATFGATLLTAVGLALLMFVAMELSAGTAPPGLRPEARYRHSSLVLAPGDRGVILSLDVDSTLPPSQAGELLEVPLRIAVGTTPNAHLALTLRSPGGPTPQPQELQLDGARRARLSLPAEGRERLELRIERLDGGATVVLREDAARLLGMVSSERHGSAALALHVLQLLVCWSACALAFGSLLRPPLAALSVVALWMLPWWWSLGRGPTPAGGLWETWEQLGQGLIPAPPSLLSWASTLVLLLLGPALARFGLRHWRSAP